MFNVVSIIGLGLMGGSLGLALKQKRLARHVHGYARRSATRAQALKRRVVDRVFEDPARAVQDAELVVICTSVRSIPGLADACRQALPAGAAMTDVGSCKAAIVRRVEAFFPSGPVPFVGSHPIAGSERQGIEAASADLYRNAMVIITPTRRSAAAACQRINALWQALEARTLQMSPAAHDRLLARTSHLPHAVAACLAACVGRRSADTTGQLCGNGFWDTTRVADGDPFLWRDILGDNRKAVGNELRAFIREAERLAAIIEAGDDGQLVNYLRLGRDRRRALARGKETTK